MYKFKTKGTCSREISFEIKDNKVYNIKFVGGCDGNLKAISKLCDGKEAQEIVNILKGNTCGPRKTSCADQFAIAITQALNNELEEMD